MQSICRLSRRWHQQFCRSPSFLSHRKCLQRWEPIRHIRTQPQKSSYVHEIAKARQVGDFVVREYDQDGDDATTRRPADTGEADTEAQEEDLRQQMKRLERELHEMRQGPFGPNSDFMQSLEKDERARLLKILEAEGGETQASIEQLLSDDNDGIEYVGDGSETLGKEADLEAKEDYNDEGDDATERNDHGAVQDPLSVTLRVPAQHKKYVQSFNDALLLAQNEIKHFPHHLDLWKWYLRCQQHVPGFSQFVDEDVWDFLWKSQTVYFPRPAQIVLLAKDMMSAGILLDLPQTLDYTDALHNTGDTATAIQIWEEEKPDVTNKNKDAGRFWQTGIEIYAAIGRPKKAQDIASTAYKDRVLGAEAWIPVIQAWANSKKPSAGSSLWACYLRLKQQNVERTPRNLPQPRVPVNVLGHISSALLNSGRPEMAVSVFRDMLTFPASSQFDSAQVYANTLNHLQGINDKTEVSELIINRIGLAALTAVPNRFKNKFFFGAWIKWLIGEGKVDDAALVVELMQEYGIRPDAKHLNGIIGAWLRDGSSKMRERAEQMAWGMIHERVAQVKARNASEKSSHTILFNEHVPQSDIRQLPRFLQRNVPPATIETFSCLLQRYTRLSDITKSEHLTDIMIGPADIKPNAFILNHWMYLSLRQSDLSALWQRYMQVKSQIKPDLETFAVLWEGCKRNLDRTSAVRVPSYPTPRQLVKEMYVWLINLDEKKRQTAKEAFSGDLYDDILRCFCSHSDLPGTLIVLGMLREQFFLYPHNETARAVLMSVARMYPEQSRRASRPRQAALKRQNSAYRAALGNLAAVMQGINDTKAGAAIEAGATHKERKAIREQIEDDQSMEAGRLRLESIQVFLAMVLKRRTHVLSGDLVNELIVAGKALGVELGRDELLRLVTEAEAIERDQAGPGQMIS